jgi:hypothetical protein
MTSLSNDSTGQKRLHGISKAQQREIVVHDERRIFPEEERISENCRLYFFEEI